MSDERARLAAQRAKETDPVQREAYALAARAGFDWYDTESSARRMAEHAASEVVELRAALRALVTAKHIDLGDLVYNVREAEGEGWEGPAVKAWSDAVVQAKRLALKGERHE